MHRTGSNETAFVSETPYIINDKNVIIAPGQGKKPVSILCDELYEEQAFPYLLPEWKFGYETPQDTPISSAWYFDQRLLSFNQYFSSDAIFFFFFAMSVYEQKHFRSSIKFAMHKIEPGAIKTGTVKINFKGTIERFVARDDAFLFMSSVNGTPAHWEQFGIIQTLGNAVFGKNLALPPPCNDP